MSKIILTAHQKGGVGKSTLSFNLAVNLKENAKVCIIDFDAQGSLYQIRELSEIPIFLGEKLKEVQNSDFDFIFIDTPPYLSNALPELCNLADVIIIPTKAGVLDLLAIKSTIDIIEQSGNEDKALIVFNMVKPNTTLTEEIKNQLSDYNVRVSKNMISDLVAFSRSVLINGVEDNNKAQKQIDALTKEVLTIAINN
ncbi:ParA family protein [Chryseobacterium sp. Ch-15]|uniref:ParA family protein n=3 Tax=Chryseobacterium muglaense TaxID=2893752 RepID=A0ABR8MD64_9FLAO|nr:ParA family protein [Chryseobacterium muglaense]MBD3906410.1 ParA family protein [Chryseobacterium muglaense]MCM2556872.1 ParA family protein [Chryseobacterium muglaense]